MTLVIAASRPAEPSTGRAIASRAERRTTMNHPMDGVTVGFVKVPVSDFERACAFYRDTLGLREDFAVTEYGWAQYGTDTVPICLYQAGMGGGEGEPGGETGLQLRVRDARAAHEHLGAHAGELQEGDDGTKVFIVKDPDGNAIQVAQLP
jgi:catechol 2,3-dioxygenase-like lactoylglutathione lyase family enzyme